MNTLSDCGKIAFDKDKDRFLTATLAPDLYRELLYALIAFNHEVAKTRESVSEVMLGQIRLQWWRETIEECYSPDKEPRRHEVVQPLHQAIQECNLTREHFDAILEAREEDFSDQGFGNLQDLMKYAGDTSGRLTLLQAETLGAKGSVDQEVAMQVGTAWALVGMMRALPFSLRQKVVHIPADMLKRYDIKRVDLIELRNPENLKKAVKEICDVARGLLAEARSHRKHISASILPALHIAGFADSYLKQLEKANYDTWSSSLARPSSLRNLSLLWNQITKRF